LRLEKRREGEMDEFLIFGGGGGGRRELRGAAGCEEDKLDSLPQARHSFPSVSPLPYPPKKIHLKPHPITVPTDLATEYLSEY
jgi:hypothetical protein